MALVLDTGPVFAYLDADDRFHRECRQLIHDTTESLVIPAPVLVEVDYWISVRLRSSDLHAFLDDIVAGAYRIEELTSEDYVRVRDLCEQYSDLDLGFVDAAVMAIVERLNEPKLATLDHRHFSVIRPRHVDSLQLLPE